MIEIYLLMAFLIGIFALGISIYLFKQITSEKISDRKVQTLSNSIRDYALTFLKKQYHILSYALLLLTAIIVVSVDMDKTFYNEGMATAVAFVLGAICSVLASVLSIRASTRVNAKIINSTKKGKESAINTAFSSGSIVGYSVAGISILGVTLLMIVFRYMFEFDNGFIIRTIAGFGLGASIVAIFARIGGGIFTKAADLGSDFIGKYEKEIPEDDPRNPASLADNVGDHICGVAGIGADIFESLVLSLIAAMTIGWARFNKEGFMLPFAIVLCGIVASAIATWFVKYYYKKGHHPSELLRNGLLLSAAVMFVMSYFVVELIIGSVSLYVSVISGLLLAIALGYAITYFTSSHFSPVKKLSESALAGAGNLVVAGLSLGYLGTLVPMVLICIAVYVSYTMAGFYGVSLAALGFISTFAYVLSVTAYLPIVDSAISIASMTKQPKKINDIITSLVDLGKTVSAFGRSLFLGGTVLSTLGLLCAFIVTLKIRQVDFLDKYVLIGIFIGTIIPFIFSALSINSVGSAASAIVSEVRRQFRDKKGLMRGTSKADYSKCIDIATFESIKDMILPGVLGIGLPILVGVVLGANAIAGLLIGAFLSGSVLMISMATSGAAIEGAKKYIEEGHYGGKSGIVYKAAILGDNVGDVLKDAAAPSIGVMLKLMCVVSLVFCVLF